MGFTHRILPRSSSTAHRRAPHDAAPPPRAPPPGWPTPIGTICIVLGAIGAFWGAVNAAGTAITSSISVNGTPLQNISQALAPYLPWMVAANLAAGAAGGLLLAGGIALCLRRRWSVPALRWWAVLKILIVPTVALATYLVQHAQQQAMLNDPAFRSQRGAAIGMGIATGVTLFMNVLMCLWGWALPIFTLIWFARPKIKADIRSFR